MQVIEFVFTGRFIKRKQCINISKKFTYLHKDAHYLHELLHGNFNGTFVLVILWYLPGL